MKLSYNLLLVTVFIAISVSAKKTPKYPVAEIPKELLNNADAVVRLMSTDMYVASKSKVQYTETYVITILKESAANKGKFREAYSKLSSVSDIQATVYDANGDKIKSFNKSDITDYAAISGFSIYEDMRVKYINPKISTYPYTIEYKYKKRYNSAFYSRGWMAFDGYNTAIEKLQFRLQYGNDCEVKYKENNLSTEGTVSTVDGTTSIFWEVEGVEAPIKETNSTYFQHYRPYVNIEAKTFSLGGITGSTESWEALSTYFHKLNEGKDKISDETIEKVAALLNDDMTDYEKIAAIYQYSQKKNRYVSIQEGIGGLQTFGADVVDRLSYGDCKALSNYVVTLLKNFGFDAQYAIIHAGSKGYMDEEFVSNYFNHVIACVPLKEDTVWLECTSSNSPCGYLGDFTDDRKALLVKEKDGGIVNTPAFNAMQNNVNTDAVISVTKDGTANIDAVYTYTGNFYGDNSYLIQLDEKDRRKKLVSSIDLPNMKLNSYDLKEDKLRKPKLEKHINASVDNFSSFVGSRMFVNINPINSQKWVPRYSRNRVAPLLLKADQSHTKSISFVVPDDYQLEIIPDDKRINSEFGSYQISFQKEDGKVKYQRSLILNKGEFPKEKYNEYVEFIEKVVKLEKAQLVFKKKA
ncbi:DUF3857 domain-containing protein [Saccharicrinis aurantiacus]|uniref:DUF3857 domain-containing protein n=1 Tax=Saccharicrinis aurantiacus TaxID=1849719 RepID=UPI002492F6E2|nr:DUF3857 domain-containing protein [Saccharicrinis aurantiacus]